MNSKENNLNFELIEMPDDKYFVRLGKNIMSYYDLIYNLVYIKEVNRENIPLYDLKNDIENSTILEVKFTNSYNKSNETVYLYNTSIADLVVFLASLKDKIIINPIDELNFDDNCYDTFSESKDDLPDLPLMHESEDIESPVDSNFYCVPEQK